MLSSNQRKEVWFQFSLRLTTTNKLYYCTDINEAKYRVLPLPTCLHHGNISSRHPNVFTSLNLNFTNYWDSTTGRDMEHVFNEYLISTTLITGIRSQLGLCRVPCNKELFEELYLWLLPQFIFISLERCTFDYTCIRKGRNRMKSTKRHRKT